MKSVPLKSNIAPKLKAKAQPYPDTNEIAGVKIIGQGYCEEHLPFIILEIKRKRLAIPISEISEKETYKTIVKHGGGLITSGTRKAFENAVEDYINSASPKPTYQVVTRFGFTRSKKAFVFGQKIYGEADNIIVKKTRQIAQPRGSLKSVQEEQLPLLEITHGLYLV